MQVLVLKPSLQALLENAVSPNPAFSKKSMQQKPELMWKVFTPSITPSSLIFLLNSASRGFETPLRKAVFKRHSCGI
jgi:hypothetical protein